MKLHKNNQGFALVTALMITMLSLVIIMGILYVVTQNIRSAGGKKAYQNAVEASYGGADVTMYNILPTLFGGINSVADMDTAKGALALFGADLTFNASSLCLIDKLTKSSADWSVANCGALATSTNIDPRVNPDISLTLNGLQGQRYTVSSKIVDTSPGVPYVPPPVGGPLFGHGAASSSGAGNGTYVAHYIYRIEVAAQRATNATEQGAVSVLYEY